MPFLQKIKDLRKTGGNAVFLILGAVIIVGIAYFGVRSIMNTPNVEPAPVLPEIVQFNEPEEPDNHQEKPETVRAIYLTSSSAKLVRIEKFLALADRTEINSLVIDIKDDSGAPSFRIKDERFESINPNKNTILDLEAVTKLAHEHNLYLIARLPVFQDSWFADRKPELALKWSGGSLWRDNRGIRWLDPASEDVWDYNATIAEEAYTAGFDEIQFDYIRFASDGNTAAIRYPSWDGIEPKAEVLRRLFVYFSDRLRDNGIPVSVDLFGFTFRVEDGYDLNIGQRLAYALPNIDFVSPMVYPSHYPNGFMGFANPAAHPGAVVKRALSDGQTIIDDVRPGFRGVRPWLQDFDIGANYTAALVRAQIDVTEESGADGWMLWNARNIYTETALKSAEEM